MFLRIFKHLPTPVVKHLPKINYSLNFDKNFQYISIKGFSFLKNILFQILKKIVDLHFDTLLINLRTYFTYII